MSASLASSRELEPEREFPAQSYPDNIPLWTENYCFVAYDPTRQIGLWTHLGRAPFDSTLWRELSIVYVPNGERLVNKGYGRSETARGPGGATMAFECVEPFRQWRMSRDGGSVRTTVDRLYNGTVGDQRHERVGFDLTVDCCGGVWDWGEVEDAHRWGKLHYEQLVGVKGTVTVGGEAIPFDGQGLRDHTSGARDFTIFSSHIWSWANFPSGRGFILLHLVVNGQYLTRAVIQQDGVIRGVEMHNSPVLTDRSQHADPYVLELGEHRIAAEILHPFPNGFDGPNDICIGYDPTITATANFENLSRFEWDGEIGYGHTERSIRLG
ncbi:hypothetical protein AWC05_17425 [Mycobacterium florentinum]|uniref:6-phosphofructokinase n=1 Tax=Mycobacterium florentinum TaxID=292462 RepID=A0A1X1UC15_MYCFL|nr:hypothetical protein [Mycobacterium florentinum]MCV7412395.1 hypothetical protein [Mycobacterium florentinum]ORV54383.1 hypothetical protein AWC05_17425 [Mycobacterium florentinum]BBX81777.1 hypothetical protein MFLOJ_55640 [Mycobacterium florentinum]